jgi:hypothetical protein
MDDSTGVLTIERRRLFRCQTIDVLIIIVK